MPRWITLVGHDVSDVPDSLGRVTFVLRDLSGAPIPGFALTLDFSSCTDLTIGVGSPDGNPVTCAPATVMGVTAADGSVTFTIAGAGRNTGGAPGPGLDCGVARSEGINLGRFTVVAPDENGAVAAPGVEILDLAAWLVDYGSEVYRGRSDFTHDGRLDVLDLSAWLKVFSSGRSAFAYTPFCP